MTLVYIVRGDTGDYSDFCMWDVKAYRSKDEADALCARLNDWLRSKQFHRDQCKKAQCPADRRDEKPPEDPGYMSPSYGGNEYDVWPVDVVDL